MDAHERMATAFERIAECFEKQCAALEEFGTLAKTLLAEQKEKEKKAEEEAERQRAEYDEQRKAYVQRLSEEGPCGPGVPIRVRRRDS